MKIGFLIRYFEPGMGGAENNCYYLARELANDKKNKVSVFCSGEKEEEEVIDKIRVFRSRQIFGLTYYFAFYPSIINKILKADLDILHVHGFGFIQNDIAIRKLRKIKPNLKIVCTPHGPFMALKKYGLIPNLLKFLYMPCIRRTLKNCDRIIKVNPYQQSWITKDYHIPENKIVFLPNGITDDALKKLNKNRTDAIAKKYSLKDKFVISYLGRIQKYKGIDQIIEIMPNLVKIYPEITFVAIGRDAEDMSRLKKLAKERGVEKNVVFTGEVSEENKFALLDLSEIFIFPSEWEAFGIVVLEAMARGNAIISTRTEGGLYLVKEGENGYLFDYQNKAELLEKIKKIIRNNKLRTRMQKNNIKKAKSFLWSKIVKDLKRIYDEDYENKKN